MYLRRKTWLPVVARSCGLGAVLQFPYVMQSDVGTTDLPCVSGAGPLQPGQSYCDISSAANPPGPVVVSPGAAGWWDSVKPYAFPVGLGIAGLVFLKSVFGGRR